MILQKKNRISQKLSQRRQGHNWEEQGVTLLLAILILASLLSISFSIATILFVEIRSSGDLLRTEGAIYGAQAVTEEAIFQVKRKVPTPTYATELGPVTLSQPEQASTSTPIQQDKISSGSNTFANTINHYLIYDPTNTSQTASYYGRIKITYLNTGNHDPLAIYICQFDPHTPVDPSGTDSGSYNSPACSDSNPSNTYWSVAHAQLGSIDAPYVANLDPSKQQEVILYNDSFAPSGDIYVQIESFGPETPPGSGNYPPKGLPYFSEVGVNVTAVNNGVTRKIRSIIPNTGQ